MSGLFIFIAGENPFEAVSLIIYGSFGYIEGFAYTLYYTTNFIFTGLAFAVAFHCRLFNIGGEGQAYIGGLGVFLVAINFSFLPVPIVWLLSIAGAVKSYFAGRAAQEGYTSSESVQDISETQIGEIQTAVGGKETYANMIGWASQNLTESAQQAFDATMNSGSLDQIRLAIAGLQAQYENATGYEGTMLTGKASAKQGDAFRSQAELVSAMSDRRYDNDPAYRQDVIEKLDRSNLDF